MLRAGSTRRAIGALLLLPAAFLLASCQKHTDPGPGGVTVGEARALDEAAEMLEKRPAPPLADATVPAELATVPTAAAPTSFPTATATATSKPAAKPVAKPAAKPTAKPKP